MTPRVLLTVGSWAPQIIRRLQGLGAHVAVFDPDRSLSQQYHRATHILIPGGPDIHPDYYHASVNFARPTVPERDAIEYALVARALADAKPLFGICRGHQMISVVAGAPLIQDIFWETDHHHSRPIHRVRVFGSLRHLLGPRLTVNSYHHQAVQAAPKGWRIAARSREGFIEAVQHPTLPVLSVQWHPEVLDDHSSHLLFTAFLSTNSVRSPKS